MWKKKIASLLRFIVFFFLAYLRHRYLHKSHECLFFNREQIIPAVSSGFVLLECAVPAPLGCGHPAFKPTIGLHLRITNHSNTFFRVSTFPLLTFPFWAALFGIYWMEDLVNDRLWVWRLSPHPKYFSDPAWFDVGYSKLYHNWAVMFG